MFPAPGNHNIRRGPRRKRLSLTNALKVMGFKPDLRLHISWIVEPECGKIARTKGSTRTSMERQFKDRHTAGRLLARVLQTYMGRGDVLVFALPRGGVPVGYEVAKALGAELDVLIVRKLGVPNQPELAMGAISSGDALFLNEQIIRLAGIKPDEINAVLEQERRELARRENLYRGSRPTAQVEGRTVIIVDDGIATGASMRAAIMALRSKKPERIVIAVPVAPADARERFRDIADEFVSVLNPRDFQAVGQFYEDFSATEDEEVRALLVGAHGEAR